MADTAHWLLGVVLATAATGCTVAPKVVDYQGFQDRNFTARPRPAEIRQRDTADLLEGGYLLIGYIDLRRNLQTCYADNTCVQHAGSLPPPEELQQEAARRGGDVVTILEERTVLEPAPRSDCTSTRAQTTYVNNTPIVSFVCSSYATVEGTQEARVSRALIWRYEPEEAGTDAGIAANARAIEKAMAALDAAATRRDTRGKAGLTNAIEAMLGVGGRGAAAADAAADARSRRVYGAIAAGDTDAFAAFAGDGTLRTWVDDGGRSVLMVALATGHLDAARNIASLDAGLGRADAQGIDTTRYAVLFGDPALLDQLAAAGHDMGNRPGDDRPLIFFSVFNANIGVYDWLVRRGHSGRTRDGDGRTMLLVAAGTAQVDIIDRLLTLGLDPNEAGDDGVTPLLVAAASSQAGAVSRLLAAGARADARDAAGRTLMHYAAFGGSTAILDTAAALNLPVNVEDPEGRSPLIEAAAASQWAAMAWLIDHGSPLATGRIGPGSVVALLIERNQPDLVNRYVDRLPGLGADLAGDPDWMELAAAKGGAEIIEYLVARGASVDKPSSSGVAPLVAAALSGNAASTTALLARKADASATDAQGRTALRIATQAGHTDVVAALRAGGVAR